MIKGVQIAPFCRSWWVVAGSIPAGRLSDLWQYNIAMFAPVCYAVHV
nr:MAG TPA: hypothetical protein [Bacteriophage sp.]